MTAAEPSGVAADGERHRRHAPVAPAARGAGTRARLRQALASRDARRQAFLLYEVLGPPAALRHPTSDRFA